MGRRYAESPVVDQPATRQPVIRGDLDEALADFLLDYVASPRGTRAWVHDQVGRVFGGFLRERGIARVADIDARLLRAYMAREADPNRQPRPLSPKSLQHRYAGMFRFLQWCVDQESYGLTANPAAKVRRPEPPRLVRTGYTQEEIRRMLRYVHHDKAKRSWIGIRNEAIITFLVGTGVRADELLRITVDHLDFGDARGKRRPRVKVFRKGQRESFLELGSNTVAALRRYLDVRPRVPHDALWLTIYGDPLHYDALRDMFLDLEEYSGVQPIQAHRFRHTFAAAHYQRNRDMLALRDAMDHAHIQTTERYLRGLGVDFHQQARHPHPDEWLVV